MNWCKDMFGQEKPIIALLHLNAFPGDPLFQDGDSMKKTVADARKDLHALQDGGVDGILFSNEFSLPYQRKIDYIGPAAMARVIGELLSEIRIPYGIDCESDNLAAIDLAAATDAYFVRATFTGVYAGDVGITEPDIAAVLRRKKQLG
jgi:membrane complex biogenesis BtpA family protein